MHTLFKKNLITLLVVSVVLLSSCGGDKTATESFDTEKTSVVISEKSSLSDESTITSNMENKVVFFLTQFSANTDSTLTPFYVSLILPEGWVAGGAGMTMIYPEVDAKYAVGQVEINAIPSDEVAPFSDSDEKFSNASAIRNFEIDGYQAKFYQMDLAFDGTGSVNSQYIYIIEVDEGYITFLFYDVPTEQTGGEPIIYPVEVFDGIVSSFERVVTK